MLFENRDDYLKCIYDKVLTLVTCSYEWAKPEHRLAVLVSRVQSGVQTRVQIVRKWQMKSAENESNVFNDRKYSTGRELEKVQNPQKGLNETNDEGVHW